MSDGKNFPTLIKYFSSFVGGFFLPVLQKVFIFFLFVRVPHISRLITLPCVRCKCFSLSSLFRVFGGGPAFSERNAHIS